MSAMRSGAQESRTSASRSGDAAATILEGRSLSKVFPGVIALDDVSIAFRAGEVHGLVGENGAGKSTLLKVLSGIYGHDSGEILFDGQPRRFSVPADAVKLGIDVIPQELSLALGLSAAENIMMGIQPASRTGRVQWRSVNRQAREVAETVRLDADVRRKAETLSPAQQRLVMIARALARKARVLIMDEPTVALTETEVDALKAVVRDLKRSGVTVIYVSHRLDEILELTDRVTVMKDGKWVGTNPTSAVDKGMLVEQIVGRRLGEQFPERAAPRTDAPLLRVRDLCGGRVRDVSFDLYPGEILGLAGLVGSGRTEIVRMLFGADSKESGEIEIAGQKRRISNPRQAIEMGLALLPEDRRGQGAIVEMSIAANVTLPVIRKFAVRGVGLVREKHERRTVMERIKRLNVSTPTATRALKLLSGGNQQKALIAKWELTEAKVLIFDEPTAGVDVGAKQEIFALIARLAREGAGIIVISSELEEVVGLSHRVLVMREGRCVGELNEGGISDAAILGLCYETSEADGGTVGRAGGHAPEAGGKVAAAR
jgi:ribose transport system ATP-binding protein